MVHTVRDTTLHTPAAILTAQRQPLVLDSVEVPPLGFGQVLVEVGVSRICGSQIGEIDGVKGPDRHLPHLLGHEGGGTVREVGPEVTTVRPGDRVVLHWRPGAGIQSRPPVYRRGAETVSAGYVTTFNRLAVVSENRLTMVPRDLDLEVCALLADTLTTGFGVIHNEAQLAIGESVVIFGCGGIGLGVVLGAKLAGAHPIVCVDVHAHKLSKAVEYGATHTVDTTATEVEPTLREILGRDGADVVVDNTGNPEVIATGFAATRRDGRLVLVGVMPRGKQLCINTLPLHFDKRLIGSEGGASRPERDILRYVGMMQAGRFDPRGFVSHRYRLDQINEAIAAMRAGEVIHAMIHFDSAE